MKYAPDDLQFIRDTVRRTVEPEMRRIARRRRARRVLAIGEAVGKIAGYALLGTVAGWPTAIAFFLIIQAGELRAARKGL